MKKIIIGDFVEYNSSTSKLGNYHFCNCFVRDGYEALWMSNSFNPLIYLKDREDYRFKRSIAAVKRHCLADQVYGFAPFSIRLYGNYPFSRSPKIIERSHKYIVPDIKKSLQKIQFADVDVLWISNPKAYWLVNVVNYKKLIYRIADDYRQFSEFPNIAVIDDMLIKKADGVIISSSTLERHALERGKTPLVLSNGVIFEHFGKKDAAVPAEYRRNGRKRIIYVGAIKYWFDTQLVKKIAEQVEADIYLIGKCETDLSALKGHDNIYLLGPRSYEYLPGYLQHADVALIPFLKSKMTDSISPIKLYEYCSAGVAVVSANLAETAKLKAPIYIADSHDSFIQGIRHYLTNNYDRSKLIAYGKQNSWDKRYEQMKRAFLE